MVAGFVLSLHVCNVDVMKIDGGDEARFSACHV